MFEIGNSLREARLRQGLDFTELEQATKIRAKYLTALEDEKFDLLPSQTYVKGFLRSYAECLGLDGQLYVDEYNSRYVIGEDELQAQPRRSGAAPAAHRRVGSRALVFALLGIALLTALTIVAWKAGNTKKIPLGISVPRQRATPVLTPVRRTPLAHLLVAAKGGSSHLTVHQGSPLGRQRFDGTVDPTHPELLRFRGRLWIEVSSPELLIVRLNGRRILLPAGGPRDLFVTRTTITPATR